ncbi:MAG TPA: hypothetical protein VGC04_06780 [Cellulomonas sp.]
MTRRKDPRRVAANTPLPLGSVSGPVGPLTPGTETCLGCGSADLVRIRMGAPGGRDVVFVSCPTCERTGWFAEDGDGTPLTSEQITGLGSSGGDQASR